MLPTVHPYPTCKPSGVPWLGDMPEHWEVRRLKEAAMIIAGQSPPSEIVSENLDGFPFLQGNAEFGRMHPNPRLTCETPPKSARAGDILLSVRAPVGALNVADRDCGIGRGLCAVRPRYSLDGPFAYYALGIANQELLRLSTGSTYDAVTVGTVGALALPTPPLDEQRAIVRYLDHVDDRIRRYVAAKEKLIALLEEERQAVIHRAVTRGLDPNVLLKPSGIDWLGDIPAHWEVKRAKFTYREVDERSITGLEELMSAVSHITGVTPRKKSVTMFLAESNVGYKLCRPGDIVINTMWAYMAALGVARQEGLVSPSYGVYRPLNPTGLDHDYVDPLLRTEVYRSEYFARSTGITASRLRLYPESFLDIPLLSPPRDEQTAVVEYLRKAKASIDSAIDRARRQIELLQEYRTRLVADVVTGKLDVREAAAQLPNEAGDRDPIDEGEPGGYDLAGALTASDSLPSAGERTMEGEVNV